MIDLIGRRFGRLVVTTFAYKKGGRIFWNCKCDCGNTTSIRGDHLKSGNTRSCGCLVQNKLSLSPSEFTADDAVKKAKAVYRCMRDRCLNKNRAAFKNYGGRGIKICNRWLGEEGFKNFLEDMGTPLSIRHQLDRINNDGNYESSNCCWTTNKENNWHKQDSHMLTLNGRTQCGSAWVEELGIDKSTLWKRVRLGWSDEKVLTTPIDQRFSSKRIST
jgi:hypothetical protein